MQGPNLHLSLLNLGFLFIARIDYEASLFPARARSYCFLQKALTHAFRFMFYYRLFPV